MLHDDASDLDTGMPPLDQLMHKHGVRSVEIDIVPDPEGGGPDTDSKNGILLENRYT